MNYDAFPPLSGSKRKPKSPSVPPTSTTPISPVHPATPPLPSDNSSSSSSSTTSTSTASAVNTNTASSHPHFSHHTTHSSHTHHRGAHRGGRGGSTRGGSVPRYVPSSSTSSTHSSSSFSSTTSTSTSTPAVADDLSTRRPTIIDIGVNLTSGQFKRDLHKVISSAKQNGVRTMIVTGTSVRASEEAFELCKKYPKILYSTAGVHPHEASTCDDKTIPTLRQLAMNNKVVAIGECGLDFDRMRSPREVQELWFKNQLDLAMEMKLPVFLHERAAHESFIHILGPYLDRGLKACVHCFCGTSEQAKRYLAYPTCYIGLTGIFTHNNSRGRAAKEALRGGVIPIDRVMIETDAPYLTPGNMPGEPPRRCTPDMLYYVCKGLTEIYPSLSEEQIAEATTRNTRRFFSLQEDDDDMKSPTAIATQPSVAQ